MAPAWSRSPASFRMSSSLIVLRALLNAIFLLPFLAAQNPGREHVGQALRFCLIRSPGTSSEPTYEDARLVSTIFTIVVRSYRVALHHGYRTTKRPGHRADTRVATRAAAGNRSMTAGRYTTAATLAACKRPSAASSRNRARALALRAPSTAGFMFACSQKRQRLSYRQAGFR